MQALQRKTQHKKIIQQVNTDKKKKKSKKTKAPSKSKCIQTKTERYVQEEVPMQYLQLTVGIKENKFYKINIRVLWAPLMDTWEYLGGEIKHFENVNRQR